MKNKLIIIIFLLLSTSQLFAQEIDFVNNPQSISIPDSFKKFPAVYLLKEKLVEYQYNNKSKEVEVFQTDHLYVKVLDDKGIEKFNTFSFYEGDYGFDVIKARSIQPSGKIVNVADNKIKTQQAENGGKIKLVAIEGLEKGSEVEIITRQKYDLDFFGYTYFQFSVPILNAKFSLKYPETIKFEVKGYNGFPNADTVKKDSYIINTAKASNIEAIEEEEEYSNMDGYLKRVDYKLSYVDNKPGQRLYSWDELTRAFFDQYYTFDDKELKQVQKFLTENGVTSTLSEEEKITKVEDLIKNKINLNTEVYDEQLNNVIAVLNKKTATKKGLVKLICASYVLLDVPFEFGVSAAKNDIIIDKEFENWKVLKEYYIYFPGTKKFISPDNTDLRYPYSSTASVGNWGIFCKVLSVGGTKNAKSQFRKIVSLPMEFNNNDLDVSVNFNGPTLTPEISAKHSFLGHYAEGLRTAFLRIPEDKKKELAKSLTSYANTIEDIKTFSVENTELSNFTALKPLIVNTKVVASELNGKAGNKYLFKLGLLIGQQNEMYKEVKKRIHPIEIQFTQAYHRQLTISIPEGYEVKNPEVADTKKDFGSYGFISTHKMEGRNYIVNITEYYKETYHDAGEIEHYREVINAAADFNKLVLVLEKKP